METIAKIRRAYFLQGKAIKEICRELRISRKVVRKVIRTGATEFRYERSRQPMPRLGVWRERLEASLEANAQKPPRDRLTLVRIFEDMQGLGFDGSYAALRRYAVSWREQHSSATSTAYIPLTFAPGEAYQFERPRLPSSTLLTCGAEPFLNSVGVHAGSGTGSECRRWS